MARRFLKSLVFLAVLGAALAFAAPAPALAKDLGTIGKTYEISEQDFLVYIQQKLQTMKKSGQLAALRETMKKRVVATIMRPQPVKGIKTANVHRTFYYDPTITVNQDIRDMKGRLIMAKGRRVNPLDSVSMNSIMVFVNGDDPAQIDWALRFRKKAKLQVKIILVAGPVIDLMKKHKVRFYFDQHGKITAQLGITRVPAKVYQEGRRLRIDQIAASSLAKNHIPGQLRAGR